MFLKTDPSWAKRPPRSSWVSVVRRWLVASPMMALFAGLEWFHRHTPKDTVLFVFPYREYCENTRELLKAFISEMSPALRPVAFAYDRELVALLEKDFPGAVVYARSRAAYRVFFRSSLVITSRGMLHSTFYPFFFVRSRKTLINLWHGIPLKRLGLQTKGTWEGKMGPETQTFDYWIACSKYEQLSLAACFALNIDRIWITGTPRNDILFRHASAPRPPAGPRQILYAPTWRDGLDCVSLFPFDDFDAVVLNRFLEEHDCQLVIRVHPNERGLNLGRFKEFDRIVIDDGSTSRSVQQHLCEVAVLITDYSSIYLDYLILDRPVLFIPYDIDDYAAKRGLFYDYESVTPGPKLRSQADLIRELASALRSPGRDAARRARVRAMFHEIDDGGASQELRRRIRVLADCPLDQRHRVDFPERRNTRRGTPLTLEPARIAQSARR
jgi:CDP-glycerol glycerophosphotransferase (TagB/SpsB family)